MRPVNASARPRPALWVAAGLAVGLHLAVGLSLWLWPHPRAVSPGPGPVAWTVVAPRPLAIVLHATSRPQAPPLARPTPVSTELAPEAWPEPEPAPAPEQVAEQVPQQVPQKITPQVPVAPAVAEAPYYPRPELDVGPAPQGPILIDFPRVAGEEAGGTHHVGRLSLFIDEAGTVRQVGILPTDPPLPLAMQDAARNAFLQARFAPGQRLGAVVRSRIDIEVSFDDRPLDSMEAEAPKPSPQAAQPGPRTSGA